MSDKHEEALELIASLKTAADGLYTIGDVLGYGRGGISVKARDVGGRLVALKVAWKDQEAREQVIRETELTAKVEHPNVLKAKLLDLSERLLVAETPLMTTTLGSWLDSGTHASYEKVRGMLDVIGGVLDVAHMAGVVHGGILPEKIFIDSRGEYYIGDFSLRLPQAVFVDGNRPSAAGFAPYAPVEQRHDLTNCDGRIDQFALAVVAYELLRGVRIWRFNEEGVLEIDAIDMVVSRPIAPGVPMSASAAVRRATSREAGYRYGSMNEFVRAFAGLSKAATPSEKLVREEAPRRKRHAYMWIVPVAIAASAILWLQPDVRGSAIRFLNTDWLSGTTGRWRTPDLMPGPSSDASGGTRTGSGSKRVDAIPEETGNTRRGTNTKVGETSPRTPSIVSEPENPRGSNKGSSSETVAARQAALAEQSGTERVGTTGAVEVTINGAGTPEVFIDGQNRGRAPLTWTGSTGRHVVTLRPSRGFSPPAIEVNVAAGVTAHAVFTAR